MIFVNVSVIYGSTKKSCTYNCVQLLLNCLKLTTPITVKEFFLEKEIIYALMPITAAKSKIQTHKSVPTTPLKILFLNSFFILSLPANQKGSGMIYTLAIISPYSSFSFLIKSLTASTEGISCEQA